jgi:hypothetical protein
LKHRLSLAVVLWLCGVLSQFASADPLMVEMFPFTGEIRLSNATAAPYSFLYYSITSSTFSLNGSPAVWDSIADDYDVSGNGYIDPINNWTKFSATTSQLTEGVFNDPGGSLNAFRSVSLGDVWDAPALPATSDLMFQALESDYQFSSVNARLAIDGDYNWDGAVSMADFDEWKLQYGQSGTLGSLRADGNLNGVVDAADYTVWRNNVGLALPGFGLGSAESVELSNFFASGDVVPEPAGAVLLLTAAAFLALTRRRR